MSSIEEPVSPNPRSQRVVALPCGHLVDVSLDGSMIALSGPVLDHQANCRGPRPPVFEAWFDVPSVRSWERHHGRVDSGPPPVVVPLP
jgi:hypothetical protein